MPDDTPPSERNTRTSIRTASCRNPVLITFELDVQFAKPNGFVSVESNQVSFEDTLGAELGVFDFSQQSIGNGLAVFSDDVGALKMTFTTPMGYLSLDFGNDDPGWTIPGDIALLQVFYANVLVGTSSVVMNRNDIMDQSIQISVGGNGFDSAIFVYANTLGAPIALIEIVDNLLFCEAEDPCQVAYETCKFYFNGYPAIAPEYNLPLQGDVPFSDGLRRRDYDDIFGNAVYKIGAINSNTPNEIINADGSVQLINTLPPTSQHYSPTFFRPQNNWPPSARISHETFQVGQYDFIQNRCVRVWFNSWQRVDPVTNNVQENINIQGKQGDNCVVFRT
jgi:hypothetical protein